MKRKRSAPHSFEEQLAAEKSRLEEQVSQLPKGRVRDEVNRKIRQIETAAKMNEWLSSPGLKPPTQSGGR